MIKLLRLSESIFAVISIFFFSQGLFGLFIDTTSLESNPDASSLALRIIASLIYSITLMLLVVRWQETWKTISKNKWIIFLLLLAIVSVTWSSVPTIAVKKVVSLIGTTMFGIYLGSHYNFNRQLKLLGWSFGISIVLSFIFVLFLPSYGVMSTNSIFGAWKGIYLHKSTLGENMVISASVFYFLSMSNFRYRLFYNVAAILSVILIIFSRSATSIIALASIYILLNVLKHLSIRSKLGISAVFSFLTVLSLSQIGLFLNLGEFLDNSSKGITLSGRTPLWESLWEFIELKIWLGYGYGSFFSASHPETEMLWKAHAWGAVHSHNGYIQLLINLGFIGFVIFFIGYFYNLIKSLMMYLVLQEQKALWVFSFLLYTVVFNFTEVSFLSVNHLNWVISVAYIYSLTSMRTATEALHPQQINLQCSG
jgi:exopolysaccharide production protein ExoQ